jgi:hypothetical protein
MTDVDSITDATLSGVSPPAAITGTLNERSRNRDHE